LFLSFNTTSHHITPPYTTPHHKDVYSSGEKFRSFSTSVLDWRD